MLLYAAAIAAEAALARAGWIRAHYRTRDTFASLGMQAGNIVMNLVMAGTVFAAYLDRNTEALRAKPGYRWRLLGARLTHPPSRLRRRAMTGAPAPQADLPPAG